MCNNPKVMHKNDIYHGSTFFMAKIIYAYLFRGKLFSLFSISTKILEHKLFFNEVVYLEVYHSLDHYCLRLSSLLLSGRPVQVKR